MGAALVLLLVGLGAMAAGVLIGRYYVPDDRQLRRTARHSRAYMRALSHVLARDHETAVNELRGVVEENVEDVEPYFALGAMFRSRGEHERAIRVHQALALRERERRKLRQRAMYELGLDFRAAGMPRRATRAMEEVLLEDPGQEAALRTLAGLYEEQARFNEAAELWQRLGRKRGESTSRREHHLLVAAAQSALGRDDPDSAKQLLKAAQRLEESAHFFVAAAELAAARNNHSVAKERLTQALIADPGLAPHLLPGLIAAEEGLAARDESDRARHGSDDLDDEFATPSSDFAAIQAPQLAPASTLALPSRTEPASTMGPTLFAAPPLGEADGSGALQAAAAVSPGDADRGAALQVAAAVSPSDVDRGAALQAAAAVSPSDADRRAALQAAAAAAVSPSDADRGAALQVAAAVSPNASEDSAPPGSGDGSSAADRNRTIETPVFGESSGTSPPNRGQRIEMPLAGDRSLVPRHRIVDPVALPGPPPLSGLRTGEAAPSSRSPLPSPAGGEHGEPFAASRSVRDGVLTVLADVEARTGPRLELALIRAQLMPADAVARGELANELMARFPDALAARVAAGRLAIANEDPRAIRGALDALVSDRGALAWALHGRWQCTHCGHRPGPFSWRCGQCRRWNTLRMETGLEPPPVAPRERRAAPRVARPDGLLGTTPNDALPTATLDPGLSDAELATGGIRRSLLGRVGGWVSGIWRRDA